MLLPCDDMPSPVRKRSVLSALDEGGAIPLVNNDISKAGCSVGSACLEAPIAQHHALRSGGISPPASCHPFALLAMSGTQSQSSQEYRHVHSRLRKQSYLLDLPQWSVHDVELRRLRHTIGVNTTTSARNTHGNDCSEYVE